MGKNILMIKTPRPDYMADMLLNGFVHAGIRIDVYDPSKTPDLDDYDIIIATSLRWDVLDIVSRVHREAPDRLYYVDGEDDPFVRSIHKSAKLYFKSEKLQRPTIAGNFAYRPYAHIRHAAWVTMGNKTPGHLLRLLENMDICALSLQSPGQNIQSLSHSTTIKDVLPKLAGKLSDEKIYDISYVAAANKNNPVRARFARLLTEFCAKQGYKTYIDTSGKVPHERYIQSIKSSRVALSLSGLGYEAIRYWEIPALGTCLCSIEFPLVVRNNFVDGKEAVFFRDFEDFTKKIEWALNGKWQAIARNGKKKFEQYHAPRRRAEYLLKTINESIRVG